MSRGNRKWIVTVVRNFDRGAYDNLAAFSVKVKTIRGSWKRNRIMARLTRHAPKKLRNPSCCLFFPSFLFLSFPFIDTIKCHFAKERWMAID